MVAREDLIKVKGRWSRRSGILSPSADLNLIAGAEALEPRSSAKEARVIESIETRPS